MTQIILILVILCCITLTCRVNGFRAMRTLIVGDNRCVNTASVGNVRTQHKLTRNHYPNLQLNSNGNSDIVEQSSSDNPIRKIAYLVLWVGLVVYAFGFSPGGSPSMDFINMFI